MYKTCQNPPKDEVNFCATNEALVELLIRCIIPDHSEDSIRDYAEIGVGAYPECIISEDPLINVLMAKPDTQQVQALPRKAVLWWEQAGRRLPQ